MAIPLVPPEPDRNRIGLERGTIAGTFVMLCNGEPIAVVYSLEWAVHIAIALSHYIPVKPPPEPND